MVVFEKEEFQKKVVEWMVSKGQARLNLSTLISDITGGEDWWPLGLPQLSVNRDSREEYIKQEWTRDLVRYGRSYYRVVVEDVLGLYYAVRLEKMVG